MDGNMRQQHMFRREILGKSISTLCGYFLIILTVAIGCFLLAKGMLTFAADAEEIAAATYRAFAAECGDSRANEMLNGIALEEDKHLRTLREHQAALEG